MTMTTDLETTRSAALRRTLRSPLIVMWVLCGAGVVGGIGQWLFFQGLPWEGLGAASAIAGLIHIVARVKGVPAWPWQQHDAVD